MTKTKLVKFSLARFISAEGFGGLSVFGGGGLPPRGSDGSYVGFSGDDFNSARRALEAPVLTAGVHLTADILVQMGMEGRDLFSWDIWRSLRLALFGLLIKGPLIGLFYRRVDHVFPKRVFSHTVSKMLCDQGPFSWFINSCFLFWIPVVEGHGVQKACDTVISGIIPMQINAYKVWPAVHTVNYMFVPPSARILFVNCANLIWTLLCCLSVSEACCGQGAVSTAAQ